MDFITILEKKENYNGGITLIALVLTIIILIILAGISIAMLTGDNGILKKATTAKEQTSQATAEEKVKIAVAGSYDINGEINVEELSENLKNIEGVNTADLPIKELPATVTIDRYTFEISDNGKVELSGLRPLVSNIKVTLEDGNAIPEGGAEAGTKLKIEFTATMEGGTIETISPAVPYTTNGTEKEVTFTATGKVDGITYTTQKTISLKEYYEKTEFNVEDITKNPTAFYGSVVENYTVNAESPEAVKNAVTTWRIFYVGKEPDGTEDNIYLIADDYIPYTAVPNGQGNTAVTKKNTNYQLVFINIINDYNGGKFIWENSLGKNWLSQYLNYTTDNGATYTNREENTNANIKGVAYLMDTNVWSIYSGEKAKYAMGGPTLEMFIKSYKNTHSESNISCSMKGAGGYAYEQHSEILTSDYNEIYMKPARDKAWNMWLLSPFCEDSNGIINVSEGFNYNSYNETGGMSSGYGVGLRPIVCLKSGIQLEKQSEGIYSIK